MANRQDGGYSCKFVKQPKELQTECMICLCILREPNIVSCCGVKFCQVCITAIVTQRIPCPNCQSRIFSTMPDKQLKRQLDEREVYCCNEKQGCKWTGQLSRLATHLAENSAQYNKLYCDFQNIPCPRCNKQVQRKALQKHIKDTCPQRDIPCLFAYAGCKDQVRQTQMEIHLQKNTVKHSLLLGKYAQAQANDLQTANRAIANLKQELLAKINTNTQNMEKMAKNLRELRKRVDYALYSTRFVRFLLIAITAILLGAVAYVFFVVKPPASTYEKVLSTAVFGGILLWLLLPNLFSYE